jgi:hypothetical protein
MKQVWNRIRQHGLLMVPVRPLTCANDLSKRTEQQAAALDEVTVAVSASSKRTEEARSVAILAILPRPMKAIVSSIAFPPSVGVCP